MNAIVMALEAKFREHANPEKAELMEAYMRNQFVFLGIKTPERTQLLREFWKQTERLFDYIRRTKDESEFFIRKAIGWALREYAKTDAAAVHRFVKEMPLSPLSKKEALKHIL